MNTNKNPEAPTPLTSSIKSVLAYSRTLRILEENRLQTVDQDNWEPVGLNIELN